MTRTGHFPSQQMYFEALKARGFEAYMLQANSVGGTKDHALGPIGMRIAGWCASGVKSDEIMHKVQQGLQ